MANVTTLIFYRPAAAGEAELVRTLAAVREDLTQRHAALFRRAGARVRIESDWHEGLSFGEVLARVAPARGGVIVLSGGATPLLNRRDAERLVAAAATTGQVALTNNRYSSDVCAVADASVLRGLPPLPSDNALPRWLEEHAGYTLSELPGRERLGIDLDTPADIALAALARAAPSWLRRAADTARLEIPRLAEVRAIARDPHRELLVFGRSGSRQLRWLERNVRCRVRFLAEERGMRASSPLAIRADPASDSSESPRVHATLGYLLDARGPDALASTVAGLGDGAIIDTRVLLAHRFGADEFAWPSPADRYASDLHRFAEIKDGWLQAMTKSAAGSGLPILLGGHSLVGPGIPLLFG